MDVAERVLIEVRNHSLNSTLSRSPARAEQCSDSAAIITDGPGLVGAGHGSTSHSRLRVTATEMVGAMLMWFQDGPPYRHSNVTLECQLVPSQPSSIRLWYWLARRHRISSESATFSSAPLYQGLVWQLLERERVTKLHCKIRTHSARCSRDTHTHIYIYIVRLKPAPPIFG